MLRIKTSKKLCTFIWNMQMTAMICMLTFGIPSFALDPRTTVPDGTSMQVHDYHCTCKKISNSTGKSILVPWKTSSEWTSFFNSTTEPNITKSSCIGVVPDHPLFDVPDLSGNDCYYTVGPYSISNIENSGGYALDIDVPSGLSANNCVFYYRLNNGGGPGAWTALATGLHTLNVCNNSEISFYIQCAEKGTHGPHAVMLFRNNATKMDQFEISFENFLGGTCDLPF